MNKVTISLYRSPWNSPHAFRVVEWTDERLFPTLLRFRGHIYVCDNDDPNKYYEAEEPIEVDPDWAISGTPDDGYGVDLT